MNKTRGLNVALALVVSMAVGLSACSSGKDGVTGPLHNVTTDDIEHAKTVGGNRVMVDNGTVALPGKPGYKVHQYLNIHDVQGTHFLYVIEKDGVPTSAMAEYAPHGKTADTVSVVVAGDAENGPRTLHCASIAACKEQLAELEKPDPEFLKYQELKKKFEPESK